MGQVRAFVAPVANESDAVIKDSDVIEWARAVYRTFGELDSGDGLTMAELENACGQAAPGSFENRFELFKTMGLVRRRSDHADVRRYVFNPVGVAALLVFDRLAHSGGVQEILISLDQTRRDIADGLLDLGEVEERLTSLRHALSISTGELLRLRSRPLEEVREGRRNHRGADRLLGEARALVHVVEDRFPALSGSSGRLISEALRYAAAANELVDRLLARARTERDFSMLEPEQYRTAAFHSDPDSLAAVFAGTVFDPPAALLGPEQVLLMLEQHRPREARKRPPLTLDTPMLDNPVEHARERQDRLRERRKAVLRLRLRGQPELDLTAELLAAGWPGAVRLVVEVLGAASDPDLPFSAQLSDDLYVDSAAPVSYLSPITLRFEEGT